MRKPLTQRSQTAGLPVEYCKAHGIQVLQDANGSFARHAQGFAQHTRGGGAASSLDSRRNNLTRMGLGSGGQGNVALDLHDGTVERKLAQGTRHGVAIELQLFAHLGKRRRIKTGLIQQGHDTLASLAHHAYRRGGGMRVEHLGTVDGAHATCTALGNKCHRDIVTGARPSRVRDRTGRKADLLGSRRVHGGQGRSQHIHCSIESRGICVEHRTARSKLAHGSLVHKPTQNDLDLATEGKAAWLYLVENGETVGSYSVRGAWNVPTLNAYHYSTCDAPENTDRQLILWLSDNDNSYFSLNKNTGTQQPGFTPHNKTSYLGFYEGTNIVAYHRSMTDPVYYYEAQDNFSIVDNDGRTLYDVIRTWYDEAELSALREEIGPLDKSLSWQEAAQQWADLYEGVHLNVTTGSEYKYTWVKTSVKPSEETTAAFRENGRIDENTYCFSITTEFVAESEWALSRSMAGNTGNCDDPDAPEGAYEYYCCCTITLEENGWHGEMCGTSW